MEQRVTRRLKDIGAEYGIEFNKLLNIFFWSEFLQELADLNIEIN